MIVYLILFLCMIDGFNELVDKVAKNAPHFYKILITTNLSFTYNMLEENTTEVKHDNFFYIINNK